MKKQEVEESDNYTEIDESGSNLNFDHGKPEAQPDCALKLVLPTEPLSSALRIPLDIDQQLQSMSTVANEQPPTEERHA